MIALKSISKISIWSAAVLCTSFFASFASADCYVTWNCGGNAQCAQAYGSYSGQRGPFASCSGYVQQDSVSSCTCGAATGAPALPAGGDPATVIGTQLGNMLFNVMTAPAQPKTPAQIEAERQAEIQRQQREAERQAKIQKYLNDEAEKKRQKDAALDKEAEDSLSLLDHKPAAMSDADLLAPSKNAYAPSLCTDELRGLNSDLDSFVAEAKKEGMQFTVDDALKNTRRSLAAAGNAAKDSAASKIGMKDYADDYNVLKREVDKVKKEADYISEVEKCVETKGCSLMKLSEKYNQDLKEWVKGLATQGLHEAADRVDKAGAFYKDYTNRLEQHNERIVNGAAKCLAN